MEALKKGASAGHSPQLGGNLRGVRGTSTGALTVGLTTLRAVLPKDRGCAASERGKSRCPREDMENEPPVRTHFLHELLQYSCSHAHLWPATPRGGSGMLSRETFRARVG